MAKRLGVDVGVRREGGYKVATSEAEAERLHEVAREQRARGLNAVALDAAELRRTAPWISPECVAATFSPQDGFASPTLFGPALRRAVERAGATIVEDAAVEAIQPGDPVLVSTRRGEFRARSLAIAAGAWSERLAAMVDPALAPIAPFYVDLLAAGSGDLPQGGETVVSFTNNHFGYALTWYGFAIVAVVMLGFWLWRQRRAPVPFA